MAVLQITKRLLGERNDKAIYAAMDEALEMAAPKDHARTWWSAHRALVKALPPGYTISTFSEMPTTTSADIDGLLADAIRSQGAANIAVSKGAGR